MKELEGCEVSEVRVMSEEELETECWDPDLHQAPQQIVLENGTRLFPAMDPEGNGTGWFVGLNQKLVRATFLGVTELSKEAAERMGWAQTHHRLPVVLQFEHVISGFKGENALSRQIIPACDPEQKGPGAVFGRDKEGAFTFARKNEKGQEDDQDEGEDSSGDALDDLTDEILESETEIPEHHFFARLTRRTNGRYAVEISLTLQSGGHDNHWDIIGGSVGYGATVFDTEKEARTYFKDVQELSNDEMDEKYGDQGLWVSE